MLLIIVILIITKTTGSESISIVDTRTTAVNAVTVAYRKYDFELLYGCKDARRSLAMYADNVNNMETAATKNNKKPAVHLPPSLKVLLCCV